MKSKRFTKRAWNVFYHVLKESMIKPKLQNEIKIEN